MLAMLHSLTASVCMANSKLRPAIASLQLHKQMGGCKSNVLYRAVIGKLGGKRQITYMQGQSPRKGVREYFYYIDHQGQLFLDDTKVKNFITCFKDSLFRSKNAAIYFDHDTRDTRNKQFLAFFFKRLKVNNTGIFDSHFPYISPCGKEINYVRCDDRPIVFSSFIDEDKDEIDNGPCYLTFNGIGPKMKYEFQPHKLCMLPKSGRIYHPGPDKVGGVGLVKSSLAIELSRYFVHKTGRPDVDPPTHFMWNGAEYELDNELWSILSDSDLVVE